MIGKQGTTADSLRTRRFESFWLALLADVVLCALGFYLRVSENLLLVGVGSVNVLAGAALGFGNWHDRGVRMRRAPGGTEQAPTSTQVNIGIDQKP